MKLYLVLVATGESTAQARIFALRSNLSVLEDGVRRLATATTASEDLPADVQVLIESNRDVLVQIHQ
jgi:hypothetical protein